jgi:hypothetical protein
MLIRYAYTYNTIGPWYRDSNHLVNTEICTRPGKNDSYHCDGGSYHNLPV